MSIGRERCRTCTKCEHGCILSHGRFPDTDQSKQVSLGDGAETWGEALEAASAPGSEGDEPLEPFGLDCAEEDKSLLSLLACALGD